MLNYIKENSGFMVPMLISVAIILLCIGFIIYMPYSISVDSDKKLKWEKMQYQGALVKELCSQKEICEPLIEFKNKLSKDLE